MNWYRAVVKTETRGGLRPGDQLLVARVPDAERFVVASAATGQTLGTCSVRQLQRLAIGLRDAQRRLVPASEDELARLAGEGPGAQLQLGGVA